jgi:hypothetical protein
LVVHQFQGGRGPGIRNQPAFNAKAPRRKGAKTQRKDSPFGQSLAKDRMSRRTSEASMSVFPKVRNLFAPSRPCALALSPRSLRLFSVLPLGHGHQPAAERAPRHAGEAGRLDPQKKQKSRKRNPPSPWRILHSPRRRRINWRTKAEIGRRSGNSKAFCYHGTEGPRIDPITRINAGDKTSACRRSHSCHSCHSWAKIRVFACRAIVPSQSVLTFQTPAKTGSL